MSTHLCLTWPCPVCMASPTIRAQMGVVDQAHTHAFVKHGTGTGTTEETTIWTGARCWCGAELVEEP